MESQEENPGKTTGETGVRPAQAGAKTQTEPKLLQQVRNVMRLAHYSIHTERSYLDSRRTCCNGARTFGPSRNCWGTKRGQGVNEISFWSKHVLDSVFSSKWTW